MVKILGQILGTPAAQPGPAAMTKQVCGAELAACLAVTDGALTAACQALLTRQRRQHQRGHLDPGHRHQAAGQIMPADDQIQFTSVGAGVVSKPAIDWQNRPTFQQVAQFPAHR